MYAPTIVFTAILTLASANPVFPVAKPYLGTASGVSPTTPFVPAGSGTLTMRDAAAPFVGLNTEETMLLKYFTCSYLCRVKNAVKCECGPKVKGATLADVVKALHNSQITITEVKG